MPLDRLHALVARRGGYDAVSEERGWRDTANALDVSKAQRPLRCACVHVYVCGGEGASAEQRGRQSRYD